MDVLVVNRKAVKKISCVISCVILNLTFLQVITSSDFGFERYLDLLLVFNVKLNICTKFDVNMHVMKFSCL